MIASLQPTKKQLVYDLVREAGVDVSDWSKYKKPGQPQTNPKYCYNWSFFAQDRVVVCLWFDHMKPDGDSGIYQHLNYSEIPNTSPIRKRRALDMNRAFFTAFKKQLTVRVIIVHGSPNDSDDDGGVEFRSLDPEPWHVESYDDEGWCRLRRGPRPDATSTPKDTNTAEAPRVSMIRFRSELANLKGHLLEHDGFPFESFTRGKIYDWESYKDFVFGEAGRRLNWSKWDSEEVGTGAILERVIHAIEINDDAERRNNLLKWQQYGAHKVLTEARNDRRCFQVESLLFNFYTGELEAEDVFEPLVELLGKKYPLLAYIFFIKDSSRFLPISPDNFDLLFERLGVDLKTSFCCSWANYTAYLSVITEIRDLLEMEGFGSVRLLDAHSFCWLLCDIDPPDGSSVPPVSFVEIEGIPGVPPASSRGPVDWEALQRERAAIGRLGEELAQAAEKKRLAGAGRKDLAERVRLISDDHTKGYDLHSFETDGSDRLIEVKTTCADGPTMRFYTTYRQIELARSGVNHFYYLVRGARSSNPQIQAIRAENIPPEVIRPIVHEVAWTEDMI